MAQKLTLEQIEPGEKVTIAKVTITGRIGRKMMDMGVTKDTEVEIVRVAPLGDPIDIKLKGYHLSLRKAEAARVFVKR